MVTRPNRPSSRAAWIALGVAVCLAAAVPAQAGLIAYWGFNDALDPVTALDTSGRGNHGILMGPAAYTADAGGVSGLAGDYAMDFGTVNNGARVVLYTAASGAFDSLTANNTATIALWVLGHGSQPQGDTLFGFYNSTNARMLQAHIPWSDRNIYWDTGGCCSVGVHRIFKNEPDETKWKGQWNHYVFVKDGNQSRIYQNGELWHSGSTSASIGQIVHGTIGSRNDGGESYAGMMDDFAVWDTALPENWIQGLASGQTPLQVPEPATLTLLGLGAMGLAARRRKRR